MAAALAAAIVLTGCDGDEPAPRATPSPTPTKAAPKPVCPLSGKPYPKGIDKKRPAVAVKVENNPIAYPLWGLEKAEIVYEELVEGGATRFLALYHCTDSNRVGPVRSSRIIDPAIMQSVTRVLAAAGGNAPVRRALREAKIVLVDEDVAGPAVRRIDVGGLSFEHTLFGNTEALRKVGRKKLPRKHDKPPPQGLFRFGDLRGKEKKARRVDIVFDGGASIQYRWSSKGWKRFDGGRRFETRKGGPFTVDNVLIEHHTVKYSKRIVDVAGSPSIEIVDKGGKGKAILFRDGRMIVGKWTRKSDKEAVRFLTRSGKEMLFKPGTIWIELVPDKKGQIKGSVKVKK